MRVVDPELPTRRGRRPARVRLPAGLRGPAVGGSGPAGGGVEASRVCVLHLSSVMSGAGGGRRSLVLCRAGGALDVVAVISITLNMFKRRSSVLGVEHVQLADDYSADARAQERSDEPHRHHVPRLHRGQRRADDLGRQDPDAERGGLPRRRLPRRGEGRRGDQPAPGRRVLPREPRLRLAHAAGEPAGHLDPGSHRVPGLQARGGGAPARRVPPRQRPRPEPGPPAPLGARRPRARRRGRAIGRRRLRPTATRSCRAPEGARAAATGGRPRVAAARPLATSPPATRRACVVRGSGTTR